MRIEPKIHTINKLKKYLNEIIEKKIFIISGKNSYDLVCIYNTL